MGWSKKLRSFISFLVELAVYAGFVVAYYLLVLHHLGGWIKHIFVTNKTHYALLAVGLIATQGFVLERLTTIMMWLIQSIQAIAPVVARLARPSETSTISMEVPGLVVYRFGGPLFYFNAPYFARRVQEIVETAETAVKVLLINAEAITDMDLNALEVLEGLYHGLRSAGIVLALCEVKGDFRKVLLSTPLPHLVGFKIYPSVAAAVQELAKKKPGK